MRILRTITANAPESNNEDEVRDLASILYALMHASSNKGNLVYDVKQHKLALANKLKIAGSIKKAVAALQAKDKEAFNEEMAEIGTKIAGHLPTLQKDLDLPDHYLTILKDFSIWGKRQSEPAKRRLVSNVSKLRNSDLNQLFVTKGDSKKDPEHLALVKKLAALTKKLGYDPTKELTPVQRAEVREKKPALYKEYLAIKRDLGALAKRHHQDIVRSSGQRIVPVKHIHEELEKRGVGSLIPPGFDGMTDDAGALYTHVGKKILNKPQTPVKMNPNYKPQADNGYVFSTDVPDAKPVRYYTVEYKQRAKADAMKKARSFTGQVHESLDQLEADMNKRPVDKAAIAAGVTAMIYLTAGRVGTVGNQYKGEPTFGISTLDASHITFTKDGGIDVDYTGKRGVTQHHHIAPHTKLAKSLIELVKVLKKANPNHEDDYLFQHPKTEQHINENVVNNYLKNKLGMKGTAKHIRTALGTQLAEEVMEKSPFKPGGKFTQKQVDDWYKKAMEAVGAKLGHVVSGKAGTKTTAMTAIGHYIDPEVQLNFYRKLGLRTPSFLNNLKFEE